jgi:hypothetical protein
VQPRGGRGRGVWAQAAAAVADRQDTRAAEPGRFRVARSRGIGEGHVGLTRGPAREWGPADGPLPAVGLGPGLKE